MDRMAAALIFSCALAVGAGLWTIGGPAQARAERRDSQRMFDIGAIARHTLCLQQHAVPATATDPRCPSPARMADPLTAQPYTIEQTIDGQVRVCALFERDPTRHGHPFRIEVSNGTVCVIHGLSPEHPPVDLPWHSTPLPAD